MSIEKLVSKLDRADVEYKLNMPLAPASTFKIGGACALAVFPQNREELALAIRASRVLGIRYAVIGKASNILFADEDFGGMMIFTSRMTQITEENGLLYAEAGVVLGALAALAEKKALSGLEFAYGIPGSVGGAVFMNAGAYGGEMSDVTVYSDYYDPETDAFGRLTGDEQRFSYRKSIYSANENLIILGAAFELKAGNKEEIRSLMNENLRKRREKQPLEYPSAGSAFKRPEGDFAARLIDECGLKGFSVGDAAVSEKHAGFVINKGNATAKDVRALMEEVARRVLEQFGVKLESEIRYIK